MSGGKNMATGGGIGFLGMLAILFIGVKLAGVISWSWWWVLAPIWMPTAIALGVAAVAFLLLVLSTRGNKRRRRNPRGW